MNFTCESCTSWWGRQGECRNEPPKVMVFDNKYKTIYPHSKKDGWCMKHPALINLPIKDHQ